MQAEFSGSSTKSAMKSTPKKMHPELNKELVQERDEEHAQLRKSTPKKMNAETSEAEGPPPGGPEPRLVLGRAPSVEGARRDREG